MSVKEQIELAILANGGEKWRNDWCECDPDVGASPCRYCAIFNALKIAQGLSEELGAQQEELHHREETIARLLKRREGAQ